MGLSRFEVLAVWASHPKPTCFCDEWGPLSSSEIGGTKTWLLTSQKNYTLQRDPAESKNASTHDIHSSLILPETKSLHTFMESASTALLKRCYNEQGEME